MLKSNDDEQDAEAARTDGASGTPGDAKSPVLRGGRALLQTILMFVVLAGSYAAMNRLIDSKPTRDARPARTNVYTIEAVTANAQDNRPQLKLFGEVQAARSVELRPLVNGEITAINPNLKVGSPVFAGDILIELDLFNYQGALAEARANLAQARALLAETEARLVSEQEQFTSAQAQMELAESDLERARSLVSSGTLTQKQVEDRRLIVSQRNQAVSQRRNNQLIEKAKRDQQLASIDSLVWKVQQAERNLQNTVLKAPFTGVVNSKNAEAGRYVSTSDVVATLYDNAALEARFTLTDAQFGRISTGDDPLIGRDIEVEWNVGLSSYEYAGVIDRIGAEIASARGGIEVVARIDPTGAAIELRPGAFVEIDVPDRLYRQSYKIPETALFGGNEIFVVEDGKLARRTVQIAAFDGEDIIIVDGLLPGDSVMTTHLTQADDGVAVRLPALAKPSAPGEAAIKTSRGG